MTEHEDALVPAAGECAHAVAAEERIDGDGIGAHHVEAGLRVGLGSGGDVTTLGIEDDQAARVVRVSDELFERGPSLEAACLIESAVRLVDAGEIRGGIDDRLHPREHLGGRDVQGRIEADAKEGIGAPGFVGKGREERGSRHYEPENTGSRPAVTRPRPGGVSLPAAVTAPGSPAGRCSLP